MILLAFSVDGGVTDVGCHRHCHSFRARGRHPAPVLGEGHDGRRLDERDAELGDLLAQRLPWQRRVVVDDGRRAPVRRPLQDVRAGAVGARQGDEGPTEIVLAAGAEAETLQVLVEPAEHVVGVAVRAAARRDQEVAGLRLAAHHLRPAVLLPVDEQLGQGRVHRHGARQLGLDRADGAGLGVVALADGETPERPRVGVPVLDLEGGRLAEPDRAEEQQRVVDAPIPRDVLVDEEPLHLGALEHGRVPPGRIAVDLGRQVALLQDAGIVVDELVDDGVLQQAVQDAVDVADGLGRQRRAARRRRALQRADQLAHVTRPDVTERRVPEHRVDVLLQPRALVLDRFDAVGLALLAPVFAVAAQRRRAELGRGDELASGDEGVDVLQQLPRFLLLPDLEARRLPLPLPG